MKAIEQYFHLVLFIMLHKVVPILKPVDETLVCDDHWTKLKATVQYFQVVLQFYYAAFTQLSRI